MILTDFIALVIEYAKVDGQAYIAIDGTGTTALTALVNKTLKMFVERTKCLYDDSITLTLVTNQATYNLRDVPTSVSRLVLEVDDVAINGVAITRTDIPTLRNSLGDYRNAAAAKPYAFAEMPQATLRLHPKPDQVYTNCYIAGWYLPADIAANDELPILAEYQTDAAKWIAGWLIEPRASGGSMDRKRLLMAEAEANMKELMAASERKFAGPDVRGVRCSTRSLR